MKKIIFKILIIVLVTIPLTGCWDYVGLNEITIVMGVSVDKNNKTNKYDLAFEIVNLNDSAKAKTMKTSIITSSGDTIFDAVRNAKKKVANKLYFSESQIVVISKDIAEKDGINSILNWFIRDEEIRETIKVLVANTTSAKDVLTKTSPDATSESLEIQKIINDDNKVTSSTKSIELYQVYNIIHSNYLVLALPLFDSTNNENKQIMEANGIAVFKKDKMIGELSPTQSKYYLFIDNNVTGGIISLKYKAINEQDNIALEISNNETMKSFSYSNGHFKFKIQTYTDVYLGEFDNQLKQLNQATLKDIEVKTEAELERSIMNLINSSKEKYKVDIFGFSKLVYDSDPKLWNKVKDEWNSEFVKSNFEVSSNVQIVNSAFIR